jgi:hypothetical protein
MLTRLAALVALIALAADARAESAPLEALDPQTAHAEVLESRGVVVVDLWAEY